MFNITSKYFGTFNNKPPASLVAHITMDFLTCYSCSYYNSMVFSSFSSWWLTGGITQFYFLYVKVSWTLLRIVWNQLKLDIPKKFFIHFLCRFKSEFYLTSQQLLLNFDTIRDWVYNLRKWKLEKYSTPVKRLLLHLQIRLFWAHPIDTNS